MDRRRDADGCATQPISRGWSASSRDAQYVDFQSFDDDYHESWDIESAMHPQTLVVYAQDGHYLNAAWGAPARIYSPVKLGYKNTKYLTRIMFMPDAQRRLLERSRLRVVRRRMTQRHERSRPGASSIQRARPSSSTLVSNSITRRSSRPRSGISYLPAQPDDSHTNLEWIPALGALASKPVAARRRVRVAVATESVRDARSRRIEPARSRRTRSTVERSTTPHGWMRAQLATLRLRRGALHARAALRDPDTPVAEHAAFDRDASVSDFEQLAAWYSNAAALLAAESSRRRQARRQSGAGRTTSTSPR